MPSVKTPRKVPPTSSDPDGGRWNEMLTSLTSLLPLGPAFVLIDGAGTHEADLAARIATAMNASGRPCVPLPAQPDGIAAQSADVPGQAIGLAHGSGWRGARSWDLVIWLRTPASCHGAGRPGAGPHGEDEADIVIDMHDPDWPVIRRVADRLACRGQWYLPETRAFFACRATTWDTKFGDDRPRYAAAIADALIPAGGVVIDIGCGTGRALESLRHAVGPAGGVIAIDVTPEMLSQANQASREASAARVLADARRLPLADGCADAVFAAGLISHLPDTDAGLRELARVTRPGGQLILFHPSGRAALAARHGRPLAADDPLAAGPLDRATRATDWRLTAYDDGADRFFATAVRTGG